ncbi:MAG: TatD family hydrolase [Sedimenticola sp.]
MPRREASREVGPRKEEDRRPRREEARSHNRWDSRRTRTGRRHMELLPGDLRGRLDKKRALICPVEQCPVEEGQMRSHIITQHMPKILHMQPNIAAQSQRLHRKRFQCLKEFTRMILGHGDIPQLMELVNERRAFPPEAGINPQLHNEMENLCEVAGWPVPNRGFSMTPLNSPATLIHWRPVAFLLGRLSEGQRMTIANRYAKLGKAKRNAYQRRLLRCSPDQLKDTKKPNEPQTSASAQDIKKPDEPLLPEAVVCTELRLPSLRVSTPSASPEAMDVGGEEILDLDLSTGWLNPESPLRMDYMDSPRRSECGTPRSSEEDVLLDDKSPRTPEKSDGQTNHLEIPSTQIQYSPDRRRASPGSSIIGPEIPDAWDSHFHLDRLAFTQGQSWDQATKELSMTSQGGPTHTVNLVGGVMVFCDPEEFHRLPIDPEPQFVVAVGVHPKKAVSFDHRCVQQLKRIYRSPRVTAIGEVGLDNSRQPHYPEKQEEVLHRVLCFALSKHTIILHLRGSRHDVHMREVSQRGLEITKKHCPSEQRIHLHCFNGGPNELRAWRTAYPQCYFGFTGLVKSFDDQQQEALRQVPADRLLVETDSPYLSASSSHEVNTPAYLGEVADLVGRIRGESVATILSTTLENGRRAYQMPR